MAPTYELLKTKLLKIFKISENERARRLIAEKKLDDQKPTELLERMLYFLPKEERCLGDPGHPNCFLFR